MLIYLKLMYLNLFNLLMLIILVLISIAFITLFERKILSYIQDRKGPNKVSIMGILQPMSDAIKLFNKQLFYISKSYYILYFISPIIMMMLMLMMWLMFPFITNIYSMNYSILLIIMFMSLSSYKLMMLGWSSNSVYSMIGVLRSMVQMLSYEVSFIFIIMILMIMSESYSLVEFFKWQINFWFLYLLFPIYLLFFISCLAELNRSPFDFIEGESELVSGFNVEYFSGGFALIFMVEYGMIVFMSLMMVYMFVNMIMLNYVMFMFMMFFCMMIILMRGILPRMRYDELMNLCWKIILPVILNYLLFIMGFKISMILMN